MNKDLASGYSVHAPIEVKDWHYSDATQKLANGLPEWSRIRKEKHSVGQLFLNGIAGAAIDEFEERSDKVLRQQFVSTFTMDEMDIIKRAEIPEWVSLDEPTTRVNYLPNSGFEIRTVPGALPDSWQKEGKVTVSTGLEGRNALRLVVDYGGKASLFQDVTVRLKANESWTASVWYNISTNSLTAPSSDLGLKITAYHVDNTQTVSQAVFAATTKGAWWRKTLTVSYTKETSKVRFEVVVKNAGTFAFGSNTLDVDCAQLEPGAKTTTWRPDILDVLPYRTGTKRFGVLLAGANAAHYIDRLDDFWELSVPTRSSFVSSSAGTFVAVTTTGETEVTDYFKKSWLFLYENKSPKIRKRGKDVTDDILQNYDIAVRLPSGKYKRIEGIAVEALTFFSGYLWVVIKELDLNGTLTRTLHVLNTKTQHPEPGYLRSVAGVEIPSSVPIGATIVRLEFKSEDRQHIYLSTTATQYAIRLFYDIFTVDPEARLLYLREDYSSVSPV